MTTLPTKDKRIDRVPDLRQPSTWSGIGLSILGTVLASKAPELASPDFMSSLAVIVTGIFSIFRRERGSN